MNNYFLVLRSWTSRRWLFAFGSTILTALIISLPTAVIQTPIFDREIAVTAWSIPVIVLTSILSGLLFATYIKNQSGNNEDESLKIGGAGAFFSMLAVGCPVCNKLALLALGYSGAIKYFAPVQPLLAVAGILFLLYALHKRLTGEFKCQMNSKIKVVQ